MKQFLYFLFAILLAGNYSIAQQTLNGDLEPSSSFLSTSYCANISSGIYNAGMPNSSMTIAAGSHTFVGNSGCGSAKSGMAFVGLYYNAGIPDGNRVSFKLSTPLVPNKPYKIIVWVLASTSLPACGLNFGYMNDSTGTVDSTSVDTMIAPTSSTAWVRVTGNFTPHNNDQFIFLEPRSPGSGDGLTFIDSVRLSESGAEVPGINTSSFDAGVYPNPFSTNTTLTIDEHATLPCRLVVTDVLGRIVKQETMSERRTKLDMTNIPKGAYFLRLTDKENKTTNLKLITQ